MNLSSFRLLQLQGRVWPGFSSKTPEEAATAPAGAVHVGVNTDLAPVTILHSFVRLY